MSENRTNAKCHDVCFRAAVGVLVVECAEAPGRPAGGRGRRERPARKRTHEPRKPFAGLCSGHARPGPRRDHRPVGRRRAQLLQGREMDAGRNEGRQLALCREQSRQSSGCVRECDQASAAHSADDPAADAGAGAVATARDSTSSRRVNIIRLVLLRLREEPSTTLADFLESRIPKSVFL